MPLQKELYLSLKKRLIENNKYLVIKLIMGHQIKDITEGIYTHKTKEQLIDQVNLLK